MRRYASGGPVIKAQQIATDQAGGRSARAMKWVQSCGGSLQELNTAEPIYRVRPKQGEAPLNSLGRGAPGDATTSSGPFVCIVP